MEPILGDASKSEAEKLVSKFRSIRELFHFFAHADVGSLNFNTAVSRYLQVVARSFSYTLEREMLNGPVLPGSRAVHEYLFNSYGAEENEIFRVLFLDAANRLIQDNVMATGTVDRVNIHARHVIRDALDLNAVAIVLVHNHPSGDPRPSRADVALTRNIIAACAPFDLRIVDHLIVASGGVSSLKEMGLLAAAEKSAPSSPSQTHDREAVSTLSGCFRALLQTMRKM
ncbi:MAG: JAB domain-containing protein [Parasphingorhabdus sp.]